MSWKLEYTTKSIQYLEELIFPTVVVVLELILWTSSFDFIWVKYGTGSDLGSARIYTLLLTRQTEYAGRL